MKTLLALIIVLVLAVAASPYYCVWCLEQAVVANDTAALSEWVDLAAVREQIKRRLNKEVDSAVGDVSNAFVEWMQDGIARMGSEAVDQLVTLEWVRGQLLSKNDANDAPGFIQHISYAFFEWPSGFFIRIGELGAEPVHVRFSLQWPWWRVTAVYG
jgi:hypothetical protein